MEYVAQLRGRGEVRVAAYGIADAEHLVAKELGALWPVVDVDVVRIERSSGGRVVEEFVVAFRVRVTLQVSAANVANARSSALRTARDAITTSRYGHIQWESAEVATPTSPIAPPISITPAER